MRWMWGLIGCAGAAWLAGAAASAPTPPDVFRLTLSATGSAEWDYTTAPIVEDSCSRTERSEAMRDVTFRTRRSTLVRLVDGRIRPADLGSIAGSVTLGGAWTTDRSCGDGGMVQIRDCVRSKRAFVRGVIRLASPSRGRLAFGPVRGVRLRDVECPPEPGVVKRAPLGVLPQPARLPLSKLTDPRIRRVTLRMTFNRNRPFDPPEAGKIEQSGAWTLTFDRVGR